MQHSKIASSWTAVGATLEVGSSHISQKKNKDNPYADHSLKATTQNSDRPQWLSPFDRRGRWVDLILHGSIVGLCAHLSRFLEISHCQLNQINVVSVVV